MGIGFRGTSKTRTRSRAWSACIQPSNPRPASCAMMCCRVCLLVCFRLFPAASYNLQLRHASRQIDNYVFSPIEAASADGHYPSQVISHWQNTAWVVFNLERRKSGAGTSLPVLITPIWRPLYLEGLVSANNSRDLFFSAVLCRSFERGFA